jgi:outer membrane lipoprotein carrier protein
MRQSQPTLLFTTLALLVACGSPDSAPQTGAPAAPGVAAGELSGDTTLPYADGVITDGPMDGVPATGAPGPSGSGALPGAAPGAGPGSGPGGAAGPATGGGTTAPAAPAAGGAAETTADGAAVLRRASAAYENVRSLQADFVMVFENPLLRQRLTSRGTLYQRQPDRIALRFTDPAGDLILGDGQYFYMYQPSNNPDQYFRQPATAAGQTGVNLQAQFVGNPVERFSHTLEGTESVAGRSAHVLLLVPRQRAEYRSLKVWLDERDSLARRFEITEHNGSVRRFDLQNMQVNPSIPDGVFRFTPPPGARAISG